MPKWEKRLVEFIKGHVLMLSVVFATLLTAYVRYRFRNFVSGDMADYLLPWFEEIKAGGGLRALGAPVGNYNLSYQTIIALFTYLPFDPMYLYKMLSIAFDYLMAWAVAQLAYEATGDRKLQALVYIAAVALPIPILNSAAWGQCDSIYTFFCLLSLILLLREKYLGCFIVYGFAFAFKLQAVFFLPFLLFEWVRRKQFSILNLLAVPIVNFVLCLPGIIAGQSLATAFGTYVEQTGSIHRMAINYPSLWVLLRGNMAKHYYDVTVMLGVGTAVLALLCVMVLLLRGERALERGDLIKVAFLLVYTCVLFLPGMHERYGYLYIALGVAVAALDYRTLPAYAGLVLLDLQTYGRYLFETRIAYWPLLAAVNVCIYLYYLIHILSPLVKAPAATN